MNCKPGDLAVFVRSQSGNEGKIVQCIRLATFDELNAAGHNTKKGPVWVVDRHLPRTYVGGSPGDSAPFGKDCNLRPIRDNDGEDETLTWAGLPHKEHA